MLQPPISILLRREDEELGPGPARAGYRVNGSGLAWEAVSIELVLSWSNFINIHQNKAKLLKQPLAASIAEAQVSTSVVTKPQKRLHAVS